MNIAVEYLLSSDDANPETYTKRRTRRRITAPNAPLAVCKHGV